MEKKNNKLDFSNQSIFVGMDVHKNQWSVTINLNGHQIKTYSMNPNPEELNKYLRKHYPGGEYHSVYEAGFCGYWIDRQFRLAKKLLKRIMHVWKQKEDYVFSVA